MMRITARLMPLAAAAATLALAVPASAAARPSTTVTPNTGVAGTSVTIVSGGFEVDQPHPAEYWCPKAGTFCGDSKGPTGGAVFLCRQKGLITTHGSKCTAAIPASATGTGSHYIFSWQKTTSITANGTFDLT